MSNQNQYSLKIILLGEAGVGKTCILNRFVKNEFSKEYKATIGSDFASTQVKIVDSDVTLNIWDTAGQERFKSLGPTFYRGSNCCILVYDVTKKVSFTAIKNWRNEFIHQMELSNPDDFPFLLLGNKSDLESHVISYEDAKEYAENHGNMEFYEVSAKDSTNINEAFEKIIKKAIEKMKEDNSFVINHGIQQKEGKTQDENGCC